MEVCFWRGAGEKSFGVLFFARSAEKIFGGLFSARSAEKNIWGPVFRAERGKNIWRSVFRAQRGTKYLGSCFSRGARKILRQKKNVGYFFRNFGGISPSHGNQSFGSHASSFYATVDLISGIDAYWSSASESVPNSVGFNVFGKVLKKTWV